MTITIEQLELAARSTGLLPYDAQPDAPRALIVRKDNLTYIWQPLFDHGQLHDLAMSCKIGLDPLGRKITFMADGETFGSIKVVRVDCQDFPALAEAVILAAGEQQLAKEKKE